MFFHTGSEDAESKKEITSWYESFIEDFDFLNDPHFFLCWKPKTFFERHMIDDRFSSKIADMQRTMEAEGGAEYIHPFDWKIFGQ